MKNRRSFFIALLVGISAIVLMNIYLNSRIETAIGPYEKVPVVVATQDILFNARIEPTMVTVESVPKAYLQPQAIANQNEAIGYLSALTISKGEQILKSKLTRFEDTHLALRVPEGMRAVALGVSDVTGLNGLVKPGNYVDVFATFRFQVPSEADRGLRGSQGQLDTKTFVVFQNVLVLAVGSNYQFINAPGGQKQDLGGSARNVTVALSLLDSMKLIETQQLGQLTVALRSHFDTGGKQDLPPQTPFTVVNSKEPIYVPASAPYLDLRGGGM